MFNQVAHSIIYLVVGFSVLISFFTIIASLILLICAAFEDNPDKKKQQIYAITLREEQYLLSHCINPIYYYLFQHQPASSIIYQLFWKKYKNIIF